ncbi:MAG: helix-turn-helix transcriptional regulator [Desulfobacteraceae bacterium]|nr:helix-turn-helix transcriptional regulator [Desulfobacteraceae bacterium]
MIRFYLKALIEEKQFQEGKRIRMEDIALKTGIHRTTLSKIVNVRGYNTTTDVVDKLCRYFGGCHVEKLMQYVPDEDIVAGH